MKFGFRQTIASTAIFVAVLTVLVSIDERVRERFANLVSGGDIAPWGDRASDLGQALIGAATYQSIEHAPLLVFATVGAVLVFFMLRT
jgi:hypothetical protein